MQYRGIEYSVVREENQDTWQWTVKLSENTTGSGTRKTREAALSAVVLAIDRWKTRARRIQANAVLSGEDALVVPANDRQ